MTYVRHQQQLLGCLWWKPVASFYRRFQVTFRSNVTNFVAKFVSSLQSLKIHFRIRKSVCKKRLWLVPELREANQALSLQIGLRILKWTFELRNELPNFATKFGILQWKVSWNRGWISSRTYIFLHILYVLTYFKQEQQCLWNCLHLKRF